MCLPWDHESSSNKVHHADPGHVKLSTASFQPTRPDRPGYTVKCLSALELEVTMSSRRSSTPSDLGKSGKEKVHSHPRSCRWPQRNLARVPEHHDPNRDPVAFALVLIHHFDGAISSSSACDGAATRREDVQLPFSSVKSLRPSPLSVAKSAAHRTSAPFERLASETPTSETCVQLPEKQDIPDSRGDRKSVV